jgi:hypothetical protein
MPLEQFTNAVCVPPHLMCRRRVGVEFAFQADAREEQRAPGPPVPRENDRRNGIVDLLARATVEFHAP